MMENNLTEMELNDQEINSLVSFIKSAFHPTRTKILLFIAKNNEVSVNEICEAVDCEQSQTSNHLLLLKKNNILVSKIVGKKRMYTFKNEKIISFLQSIEKLV